MSNFGIQVKSSDGSVIADSSGIANVAKLIASAQSVQETTIDALNGQSVTGVVQLGLSNMTAEFSLERTATICLMASFSGEFVNGDGGSNFETTYACKALAWPALTTEGKMPPEGVIPAIVMGFNGTVFDTQVELTPTCFRFIDLPAGSYTAQINMYTPPQQFIPSGTTSPFSIGNANLQVIRFGY